MLIEMLKKGGNRYMISFNNESPYIYTLYFKKDGIEYGIIHSSEIFLDRKALEELKRMTGAGQVKEVTYAEYMAKRI